MASATSDNKANASMKQCYENYILVDVGANLTNKKFGRDLESVVKRAKDAGMFIFSFNKLNFIKFKFHKISVRVNYKLLNLVK